METMLTIHIETIGDSHLIILGVETSVELKRRSVRILPPTTPAVIHLFCNSLARFKTKEILCDLARQLTREYGKVYELKKYEKVNRENVKYEKQVYESSRTSMSSIGVRVTVESIAARVLCTDALDIHGAIQDLKVVLSTNRGGSNSSTVRIRCICDPGDLARDIHTNDKSGGIIHGLMFCRRRRPSLVKRKISEVRAIWKGVFGKNKFEFV